MPKSRSLHSNRDCQFAHQKILLRAVFCFSLQKLKDERIRTHSIACTDSEINLNLNQSVNPSVKIQITQNTPLYKNLSALDRQVYDTLEFVVELPAIHSSTSLRSDNYVFELGLLSVCVIGY